MGRAAGCDWRGSSARFRAVVKPRICRSVCEDARRLPFIVRNKRKHLLFLHDFGLTTRLQDVSEPPAGPFRAASHGERNLQRRRRPTFHNYSAEK